MTARRSKDEILRAFRALMAELGRPPGKGMLLKRAGIRESEILYYWPRTADLAIEAGAKSPNTMQPPVSDLEVFSDFARICVHLSKIPTEVETRIATRELQTRTHTVAKRFGTRRDFILRFRDWVESQDDPGVRALLDLPGWHGAHSKLRAVPSRATTVGPPPPIRPFLPAGLQWLEVLARGDRPDFEDPAASVSVLFERRVGDAFRCLGFDVRQMGQGRGRAADILALARPDNFAVIIDAKARSDRYSVGTEDRKFFEYARTHSSEIQAEGIKRIYLAVVASAFRDSDAEKLRQYMLDSPIRAVALITASALVNWVEKSIRERSRFALSQMEPHFASNSIVAV